MKKYKWIIILANLVMLLIVFNQSISKKEDLLANGKLILLELAPVDPRSLIQGDYMRLRYEIARGIRNKNSIAKRGYCVVTLDSNGVAERVRLQADKSPVNKGEYLIKYTASKRWFTWDVNIGAESFFFQEGEAKKYEKAKYGAIKADKNGNSVLVGLYDEDLKQIE
ncbi:hypothetical protein BKI52_05225 [marine bacterium AO1-C]|nr:hypothetical protein BKI52_05225 [marine bacterium AO1-C]